MYVELRLDSTSGEIIHKIDAPVVPRENEYIVVSDNVYCVDYVAYLTTEYGSMYAIVIVKDNNERYRQGLH